MKKTLALSEAWCFIPLFPQTLFAKCSGNIGASNCLKGDGTTLRKDSEREIWGLGDERKKAPENEKGIQWGKSRLGVSTPVKLRSRYSAVSHTNHSLISCMPTDTIITQTHNKTLIDPSCVSAYVCIAGRSMCSGTEPKEMRERMRNKEFVCWTATCAGSMEHLSMLEAY